MAERQMLDDEKWSRITVGIAHGVGGAVLTAFGGGALVPVMGQLEGNILDSAFSDRIAPSPVINEKAREVASTPPVTDTTMIQKDSAKLAELRWDSKKTA